MQNAKRPANVDAASVEPENGWRGSDGNLHSIAGIAHAEETAMRNIVLLMVVAVGLGSVAGVLAAEKAVIAPGAKLEKLAGGFAFTEGPAADAQGNVFFTDQPNDRILKWSTDGKLSTFMQPCGRSNGLCFDAQGQPLGLRRREERDVVHRSGGQGHRGGEGLPRQAAERPQRPLAPARRRALLHRSILQAGLLEARAEGAGARVRLLSLAGPQGPAPRGRGPEAAQRDHRHARRQDPLRRRHRRRKTYVVRHPARRLAGQQEALLRRWAPTA